MKINIEVVTDSANLLVVVVVVVVMMMRSEPGLVPEGDVRVYVKLELCENGNGVGRGKVGGGETGLDNSSPDVAPGELGKAGRGVVVSDEGDNEAEGARKSVFACNGREQGMKGGVYRDQDGRTGKRRAGEDMQEKGGGWGLRRTARDGARHWRGHSKCICEFCQTMRRERSTGRRPGGGHSIRVSIRIVGIVRVGVVVLVRQCSWTM